MASAKRDPGGFWGDSGRYGFGSALKKRLFGFKIGDESWRWGRLLEQDWQSKLRLMRKALGSDQDKSACWVFEAMIIEVDFNLAEACKALKSLLPRNDEAAAAKLQHLLAAIEEPESLLKLNLDVRMLFLFASAFLARANAVQGKSQSEFELYRDLSVKFFERARALAPAEQQKMLGEAPYRNQAQQDYPYTDERLAATYEQAMYLVWIPPVVTSGRSGSSTGDGG